MVQVTPKLRPSKEKVKCNLLLHWVRSSATRFGEISPLWQFF